MQCGLIKVQRSVILAPLGACYITSRTKEVEKEKAPEMGLFAFFQLCQVLSPDTPQAQSPGFSLLFFVFIFEIKNLESMIEEHPQFFTATILEWKKLLIKDKYKDIIVGSLRFLVSSKRIFIYGFVIMPNHIHVIWQMREGIKPSDVQRDFLKYTAQQIKFDLQKNHPEVLSHFRVDVKDRSYQIWEHRPFLCGLQKYLIKSWIIFITTRFRKNGNWQIVPKTISTQVLGFIFLMRKILTLSPIVEIVQ